jgi:hypothetical protein
MEQLQSHIWLNILHISSYIRNLGSPSSCMTLQLLPSEFPYILEKFYFLFYQCTNRPWWYLYT